MKKFLTEKKLLLEKIFEKASAETTEKSFSGIAKYIERTLWDDYKVQLSHKTFETYYKTIVEKEEDYNIKSIILDELSKFLGFEDFKEFCKNLPQELLDKKSEIKIEINGNSKNSLSDKFSSVIINITNSPVFTMPEFISKHSNSFGLIGILLVTGFLFKKNDFFSGFGEKERDKKTDTILVNEKGEVNSVPIHFVSIPENVVIKDDVVKITPRKKECMYWNGEFYEEVFCDELIEGKEIIALNKEKEMLKKITRPDTLTVENALGKVWYAKSNRRVEFFTHHGIHPENGKTLREATAYMIEKYAKK